MAFLAVCAIGMTYVVGHSGAESVWKYRYEIGKDQQGLPQKRLLALGGRELVRKFVDRSPSVMSLLY